VIGARACLALTLLFANSACVTDPNAAPGSGVSEAARDAQMDYCEKQALAASSNGTASATFSQCMQRYGVNVPVPPSNQGVQQPPPVTAYNPRPQAPAPSPAPAPAPAVASDTGKSEDKSVDYSKLLMGLIAAGAVAAAIAPHNNSGTPAQRTSPSPSSSGDGCSIVDWSLASGAGPFGGAMMARDCH